MQTERNLVVIFTAGACAPNPGGPGGYGAILEYNGNRKEISGGFRSTTNNRMELYAAIAALEALKQPCQVAIHSDSEYLVKSMSDRSVKRWQENNWFRTKQARAANADLWEKLLGLCETHDVKFVWIRGHSGGVENERCDALAKNALTQANLPPDEGYENRNAAEQRKVKITQEGQLCRKCSTPVVKRTPKKPKQTQAYCYEYYLRCPKCHTMYMVEEAKRALIRPLPV